MNRASISMPGLIVALAGAVALAGTDSLPSSPSPPSSSRPDQENSPHRASAPTAVTDLLTTEERAWLRQHPVIRVVQDPGWPPMEFADAEGEPSGISEDYLRLVEERLGITFERVRGLDWQEAFARLKRGDLDMTTCVAETPSRKEFWAFTKPYTRIPIVIVTQANVTYIGDMRALVGRKVAVVDGYIAVEYIARDHPEIQLVKTKTVREGLDRLQRGEVFAVVDNMLVLSYYMAQLKLANLKVAGETPYVNAQAMAVRKDWAILAGILQKSLESISEAERSAIYQRWVPVRYEHGFDYARFWQVLAVFAVVVAALGIWIHRLNREIRRRKAAETSAMISESLLRIAGRTARFGGWSVTIADQRVVWSDEVASIHEKEPGYSPSVDEAIGFYAPEWREKIARVFGECTGAGTPYDEEMEIITACGNRIWVRTTGEAVRAASGAIIRVQGSFQDISERKQSEIVRQETERRYSNFIRNATDGICRIDFIPPVPLDLPEAELVEQLNRAAIVGEVNDVLARMYGLAPGAMVGRPATDFAPEYGRRAMRVVQAPHFQVRDIETLDVDSTGRTINLLENFTGIVENGRLVHIWGMQRDITERKRAEATLQGQVLELQRWHGVTLGRERRIQELKGEVNQILGRLGEAVRYPSMESQDRVSPSEVEGNE